MHGDDGEKRALFTPSTAEGSREIECPKSSQRMASRPSYPSVDSIAAFVKHLGVTAFELSVYPDGVASTNVRVASAGGSDLTVRVDHRRALPDVQEDRIFMELARRSGIRVPTGPWIDGSADGFVASARPTISGTPFKVAPTDQRLSPASLGSVLAHIHQLPTSAVPMRKYFYDCLFHDDDSRWNAIREAVTGMKDSWISSQLLQKAIEELRGAYSERSVLLESPVGIIHGDFTPPNILLTDTAEAVVLDWEKACVGPQLSDIAQAIVHFGNADLAHCEEIANGILTGYISSRPLPTTAAVIKSWLRNYAAIFFLSDAAFAMVNRRGNHSCDLRRERYFQDYCLPAYQNYLDNACRISCAVDDVMTTSL